MIKILVTSIGSLVGQNILDCLETRRDLVTIIGLNSEATNQRVFRCDKAYLVPPSEEITEFKQAFTDIIQSEKPDLILAGRDIDVVFLATYKQDHPESRHLIPCGNPMLARMMYDKYESFRFATSLGLPFALSFLYRNGHDREALNEFIETHGFPLVVKPRHGFASQNVFFLTNQDQIDFWLRKNTEVLFQEYLGDQERIYRYSNYDKMGLPLFFQVPETQHYAAQVVIPPPGTPIRHIITQHVILGGRAESLELFNHEEAGRLVSNYAEKLGAAGWSGFLNLQFKQARNGMWKTYEMNPRMVGASSARQLMGFDEIGMLVNAFYPELCFPDLSLPVLKSGIVLKSLTDQYLDRKNIEKLLRLKSWERT